MSDKMDELRHAIARQLEEILLIAHLRGLKTIDKASVVIRDASNPNMYTSVSNDSGFSFMFWRKPEDTLPDTDGWLLIEIRPPSYGGVQDPDYLALGYYDNHDGEWRTQNGRLVDGYKVLHWAAIPICPGEGEIKP